MMNEKNIQKMNELLAQEAFAQKIQDAVDAVTENA